MTIAQSTAESQAFLVGEEDFVRINASIFPLYHLDTVFIFNLPLSFLLVCVIMYYILCNA